MILYNHDGMPVSVPPGREEDFLSWGYTYQPPGIKTKVENVPQPSSPPSITQQSISPKVIDINSASLKDMSEVLGLSTAQGRSLRDNRPYESIQNLIDLFPDIEWGSRSSMIIFSQE
jgi:hypothetical protein